MSWAVGWQPWGISGAKYGRMTRDSKIEWNCRQTVFTYNFTSRMLWGKEQVKQSYREQINPA